MDQSDVVIEPRHPRTHADLRIAIVGAGFAGIGLAVVLGKAGYTNVTLFERGRSVGGTWRDNTYPGAACDVPSHLYSYSFAPKPDWPSHYSGQADILAYIHTVADRFDITRRIRFETEVTAATYDAARATWTVATSRGDCAAFDVFIPAVGQLSLPQTPLIPGQDSFAGPVFHAARWDQTVALAGKRVAIVGSAASAVQIVPELARICGQLTVFQRTPNWIIPRMNLQFGPRIRSVLRRIPPLRLALRGCIYLIQEALFGAMRAGSRRNRWVTALATSHLQRQVKDPVLRRKLTPTYTLGCKRMLVSSDYLPCFNRPNVALVTDAIEGFSQHGLRTADGVDHPTDVVVFATGFDVRHCLRPVRITGRSGLDLQQAWADGPEAYHGVAVPGFPNMFLLYGPNTNLGHNSIIVMLECQFGYIEQCLDRLVAQNLAALEVKQDSSTRYNQALQTRLAGTVWATGCGNWYGQSGRITANWSGSATAFRRQMRHVRWADFAATCSSPGVASSRPHWEHRGGRDA